jgi:hypothetical protein
MYFFHSFSPEDKWKPAILDAASQYGHLLSEQQISELEELPPVEQQEQGIPPA